MIRSCEMCGDFKAVDAAAPPDGPERSVETMMRILRGPRRDWPPDWPFWGTTLDAHRRLAAEYRAALPPYPAQKYRGRGIVILGGGAFFPGVYVVVRMIRHFGCRLPIEVWHHAQTEPIVEAWLRPYEVRCRDLDEHMARHAPSRLGGGWTSKFYAVLHSAFEQVFYMDSDCYPVGDLTTVFDHTPTGAVIWPDTPAAQDNIHWHIYPAAPSGRPPLSGGQFLIDKRRFWTELNLCQWWNERADYAYRHGFGDQDVLRGVWEQCRAPATLYEKTPRFDRVAFLYSGPDGTTLLVHRCDDKFRLPLLDLRCHLAGADKLYRGVVRTRETTYQPGLAGEDVAFSYFNEFKRRWFDHEPARFRAHSEDAWTWEQAVHQNVYRLPDALPTGALVVDLDPGIGALAHAACRRGANEVWLFETDGPTRCLLMRNLAYWGAAVRLEAAIPDGALLDTLRRAGRHIHLLRLPAGPRLWSLLEAATNLDYIDQLVGDYHAEDERHGPTELCVLFARLGFRVRTDPTADNAGRFWARRGP